MSSFVMLLAEQVLPATSINRTVGVIVWVGVIVFTLAFFVLSWTRLGNAKPLVKCLTLSVFAHVLLGIFFYGTQMLGLEMELGGDEPVTISLISEAPDDPVSPVQRSYEMETPELAEEYPQEDSENQFEEGPLENMIRVEDPATQDESASQPVEASGKGDDRVDEEVTPEVLEAGSLIPDSPIADDESMKASVEVEAETNQPTDLVAGTEAGGVNPQKIEKVSQIGAIESEVEKQEGLPLRQEVIFARLDGSEVPKPYRARFAPVEEGQHRGAVFGTTIETEAAVKAGIEWLVRAQKKQGNWDASQFGGGVDRDVDGQNRGVTGAEADMGISGLALLALMGNGHTHLKGKYRLVVQHGLEYLLAQQEADGNLSGNASLFASMYCHAMATIAVCEAYALTADNRLRDYAERAVGYTIRSQDSRTGGWRYQPADAGDMSQFGWQVLALRSAEQAGLVVPAKTKALMIKFLATCNTGANGGLAAYRPGFEATRTMTAESLACRMWLDSHRSVEQVKEASDFIVAQLPSISRPDLYYWYYGSLSLRQVGGPAWQDWSGAMKLAVPALQLSDGSWGADTKWGGYGGKVYSTAMAVLCLESFYRYQ